VNAATLVVGASGLVGEALSREFESHLSVAGTFCRNAEPNLLHLDLRDAAEVRSMLRDVRPSVILCPAAEPNVELCETEPLATRKVNVDGFRNLLLAATEIGALLVYFSSEYVFDGSKGLYSEDDECAPLNEYGRQKLECERMITAGLDRYIIARISGVYGWERRQRNFVVRLIECLHSRKNFKVPFDQLITPTYAPSLAAAVRSLVTGGHKGIFHLSGSLPLSRIDFARLVADIFKLDSSLLVPVATSELELRAARPHGAGLNVAKAKSLLHVPLVAPREGLEAMRTSGQLPVAIPSLNAN
jgi:dTDP-4-dehydrorhamnose reductase